MKRFLENYKKKFKISQKKYYDARRKDIFFIIKKNFLFNTKNLRVRKLCKKLTDRYIRSFKVVKVIGLNVY